MEMTQKPSPNRGGQLKNPKYLIIHYTAGRSAEESANWLCSKAAKASAHVIIGRDGKVIQLVPFNVVAWHAGHSEWQGLPGINNYSIGIELDNAGPVAKVNGKWRSLHLGKNYENDEVVELNGRGWLMYTEKQLEVLEQLCTELVVEYPSLVDLLGHSDIAPGRKIDPGPAIDLEVLRARVFGDRA